MTLVELHMDVGRIADALEKIRFLLEKLVLPPAPADIKVHQATLDDLHTASEEDISRMQTEQKELAERFRVVTGSPAMMQALMEWEDQQRRLYGETWKAPEDWRSILAAAGRDGLREPAGNSASAAQRRRSEVSETSPG